MHAGWVYVGDMTMSDHRPDPNQDGWRWRVDCSCGWRGPQVSLPGQGHQPWMEHRKEQEHT